MFYIKIITILWVVYHLYTCTDWTIIDTWYDMIPGISHNIDSIHAQQCFLPPLKIFRLSRFRSLCLRRKGSTKTRIGIGLQ